MKETDPGLKQYYKTTIFKETTDDWCPNYNTGHRELVRVSHLQLIDGTWRVCVWGEDDCGMEIDLPETDFAKSKEIFDTIVAWDDVTMGKLKRLGFVSA